MIVYILGRKTSLHKFKRFGTMLSMSSDYNGIVSGIDNRKKFGKSPNICKLNYSWAKGEVTKKTRKYFELHENENTLKCIGCN